MYEDDSDILSLVIKCSGVGLNLTPLNFDPWGLDSTGCAQDSTDFSC